jgi:hypothetical protein
MEDGSTSHSMRDRLSPRQPIPQLNEVRNPGSLSAGVSLRAQQEDDTDTATPLVIIVVIVVLLLLGGGFTSRGRW